MDHENTLIWLHGLGDSPQGMFDWIFQDSNKALKLPNTCKIVLPKASMDRRGDSSWYNNIDDPIELTDKDLTTAYDQKNIQKSVA